MNIKTKKFTLIFGLIAFGLVLTGIKTNNHGSETNFVKRIQNTYIFVKKFFTDPVHTGAILPSSPYLAQEITKQLRKKIESTVTPLTVLEVGAGTGVFTQEIIKLLRPQDTLDTVELDESMSEILEETFSDDDNVTVIHGSILDFDPGNKKYDIIISGLPFNSLPEGVVKKIINQYENKFLKKNGSISYFEYLYCAKIKEWYLSMFNQEDHESFNRLRKTIRLLHNGFKISSNTTWFNFPPALTYHLKRTI